MHKFSQNFQTHIEQDCTTLCWAWRLVRNDGQVLGFTDHDRDIEIEGQFYQAEAGFSPSDIEQRLGFSLDNSAVLGALSSAHITKADIDAGVYGGALIEMYRVNWNDPNIFAHIWSGYLGDITQRDGQLRLNVLVLVRRLTGRQGAYFLAIARRVSATHIVVLIYPIIQMERFAPTRFQPVRANLITQKTFAASPI
ncbi:MAG: DUF2163 domain-containing protein [Robiginitomaculum sp.]|nr:DUF2163 domain-containing protein [Robiginitomaculum sp.]